jgi:hypothetical protein
VGSLIISKTFFKIFNGLGPSLLVKNRLKSGLKSGTATNFSQIFSALPDTNLPIAAIPGSNHYPLFQNRLFKWLKA